MIVYHVAPGGPADGAGVRSGQRIVRVDGRAVAHDAALERAAQGQPAGRALQLELRDGGLPHSLSVTEWRSCRSSVPRATPGTATPAGTSCSTYGWRAAPPPGSAGRAASEDHACALGSGRACANVGFRLMTNAVERARGLRLLQRSWKAPTAMRAGILGQAYEERLVEAAGQSGARGALFREGL